jgi:hypothetical protein
MQQRFNGEIALGFVAGVLVILLFIGVSSYQTEHCGKIDSNSSASNAENNSAAPTHYEPERYAKNPQYNEGHPISCGIVGFPEAIIEYMDLNEGFFVGSFTFALFIATWFLWRSTNKLWEAGEQEIAATRKLADAAMLSAQSERAWMCVYGFGINPINNGKIGDMNVRRALAFSVVWRNKGRSPALNCEIFITRSIMPGNDDNIPIFTANGATKNSKKARGKIRLFLPHR